MVQIKEVDETATVPVNKDIFSRVRYFDTPFAYVLMNYQIENYCSYCLRKPANQAALSLCGKCHFARYCGKDCQKEGWRDHRPECARLQAVFPNLPVTEVLFLSRILDKLAFIAKNGDKLGWQKDRKFDDLMTHEDDIKKDETKMSHYDKIYDKLAAFMKAETPVKDVVFPTFCRTWINSHSIHNSSGTEIGMAMDLGVSRYDHCCRPNASLVFDGFNAMIRPLIPSVDVYDPRQAFISYVDVGRSKYQRRKELRAKWYFTCMCERCRDPDDDRLTGIKCAKPDCTEAIIITEDGPIEPQKCRKCGTVCGSEQIAAAQRFMLSLPTKPLSIETEEDKEKLKKKLEEASEILHPENIYYCRLFSGYTHVTGGIIVNNNAEEHKMVYQNYKRIFPKTDRHIGYQLLALVKSLLEEGKRDEAMPYAYEAMTIFEVCFGLEHPYYLQTLALWTYLEKKIAKTDEELLALLHFDYNRPVDLAALLAKADLLEAEKSKK